MSRRRQTLLAGALALVCAAGGYLVYQWQNGAFSDGPPVDAATTGQMVLAANLVGLDGKPQSLTQWRGKVLVVNFWATWCAPCREEIPEFIKFQDQYGARGVQFVGIAIDNKERVAPYARDIGINYPVMVGGLETMDFARLVGNRLGVLPYSMVIDRSGKTAATVVGVMKPEKLENLLKSLL